MNDRELAELRIRRLANRHDCAGHCDLPEHARDAADLPQVFELLGFFEAEARTYMTGPEPAEPQVIRKTSGRRCSTCRHVKQVTDFYVGRNQCKTCFQAKSIESQRRRREAVRTGKVPGRPTKPRTDPASKECSRCWHRKPAAEFAKDARNPDGLRSECKACFNAGRKAASAA